MATKPLPPAELRALMTATLLEHIHRAASRLPPTALVELMGAVDDIARRQPPDDVAPKVTPQRPARLADVIELYPRPASRSGA